MIVRTYSRRSRTLSDSPSSSVDHDSPSADPLLSDDPYGLDELILRSSSQEDETRRSWTRREDDGDCDIAVATTATLMEAQECGEMMEHMDEVNFALDGLRRWQAVRVRRASLLSLLTVCAGAHQRRLLRAQGTMKKIIDAILGLNFDDPPSTVASAALFYVLASDGQDDLFLESPDCVQFLIKLLNPPTADAVRDKAPSVGSRLMLIRPPEMKNGIKKILDSGSTSIILKVQEILLHCKEIEPLEGNEGIERPELTSKWIGLLTMEKACLSTVSFEDISGPMKKGGEDFKENFRELGGIDAVVNIAVTCYSNMERAVERVPSSSHEFKDVLASESAVLFLKCLKIMENATFLSKENQNHLLEMKIKLDKGSTLSCVELIIRAMKFFSGLSLRQKSDSSSNSAALSCRTDNMIANNVDKIQRKDGYQENHSRVLSSRSAGCSGALRSPPSKNFEAPLKKQKLSQSEPELSSQVSELTITSSTEKSTDTNGLASKRISNGLLRGFSINTNERNVKFTQGSTRWISTNAISSKTGNHSGSSGHFPNTIETTNNSGCLKKGPSDSKECHTTSPDGHFDPFAFDEDELGTSKWEALTTRKKAKQTHQRERSYHSRSIAKPLENQIHQSGDIEKEQNGYGCTSVISCDESIDEKDNRLNEESHADPSMVSGDDNILEDFLLSAVKVLINFTNDNLIGCRQIGSYGGLDSMASLIMNHFPIFDSTSSLWQEEVASKPNVSARHLSNKRLSDHELDFLVAILGLLVNLVEKDTNNRSRLACTRIPTAQIGRSERHGVSRDVIPLLCSIFLVNQGSGHATEDGEVSLPCNEEATLVQGEREAEMMILEAYAALLLAFLSTESKKSRENIADCLPSRSLKVLVPVLERFVEYVQLCECKVVSNLPKLVTEFHLSLNMISSETHTAVSEVIESCRMP